MQKIEQLYINNFRGIRNCEIKNIGKINIFLGKNNCGKSSVLESLFLLTGGSIPYNYERINYFRLCPFVEPSDFKLNFHSLNTNESINISGSFESGTRNLEIRYEERDVTIVNIDGNTESENNPLKDYGIYFELDTENQEHYSTSVEVLHDQIGKFQLKQDERGIIPAQYVTPSEPYENFEKIFTKIVENKEENRILEIIRTIEPSIKDIVVAGNRVLVDIGEKKRIPVQLMGDGLRKVLSVVVTLAFIRDKGVVLIDEVDNGLHYESMPILWRAIFVAAKEFDIQIFVTTHNIDSLQAAAKVMGDDDFITLKDELSVYTLIKSNEGMLTAIRSSYEQLEHVITYNLEIR